MIVQRRIVQRPLLLVLPLVIVGIAAAQTRPAAAADDALTPIHPGVPGKVPFWNGSARQFIWPPAFDFAPLAGAKAYRFTVTSQGGKEATFEAAEPWAALSPVWAGVPVGPTTLRVDALKDPGGEVMSVAGTRQFHRAAPFAGPYAKPILPYARSAEVALKTVVDEPFVRTWRTSGQPDPAYGLYRYPAKIIGSLLSGCATYAQLAPRPGDADEALEIARRAADYLIGISAPADAALASMPPTYRTGKPTERENDRWTMMMTPAEAGQGYLDLLGATSDRKYLDAARHIADAYVKLQLPCGTWHLKVDNRTGEPVAPNLLIPTAVIDFLDRLATQQRLPEYAAARDRAIEWTMQNPARTFDWSAQFDDIRVRKPYENLAKHEACQFVTYLFSTGRQTDLAEQTLRFAEDQFIVWENPSGLTARRGMKQLDPRLWITPSSCEQYAMFEPVSGSSAFMITAYVHAWRATHKPIYLEKARSLGNALTFAQQKNNGRYPTRMIEQDMTYWINSTINTARAMQLLAAADSGVHEN